MENDTNKKSKLTEELLIAGQELLQTIKRIISEGNAKSIRIRSEDGSILLEIPMNTGLALGGAMVLLAPFLAAVTGIIALHKKVRVEIIRKEEQ
jgi:hypothetical protein